MANEKKSYPAVPISTWFAIRKRFIASPPRGEVTINYITDLLNMNATSARISVITPFKQIGFIGADNKLTDRGLAWRDDEQYAEVCNTIREEVYPTLLLDLAPNPSTDPGIVIRWFTRQGIGESRAKTLASFYMLLLEADPNKLPEAQPKSNRTNRTTTSRTIKSEKPSTGDSKDTPTAEDTPPPVTIAPPTTPEVKSLLQPSLHFDIQIHISPESTPEQIDQIFASMAKHLKELR